ncbi:SGNH/GDSL hydrolase family protein [Nocardioides sp. KIGAM211]|uniref:SGNH/GDSL hydrolase family protein n=1 Tax=Nocardioides luti TaxID=2761101 RepID=A0A7X0RI06_9ACTN|nr:SGNH/GDSL hydrolase family protein [Nocardioides luti]MBB6628642.1 SGNH/GDSL hydrolase family protein [Nocardioides luti]
MRPPSPRLLAAAALVATGAGLAGGGVLYAAREFLHRQGEAARRVVGHGLGEVAPDADGRYKKKYGDPVELLLLGDSIAAGLGADLPQETLGGRLAGRLAKATRRTVHLTTAARVGSESSMLGAQLDGLAPSYRPHVAVIVVGGNDVTHRVPLTESVRHLEDAVTRLRERGAAVVVGTCPDLGALRPVPQPLRSLGSRASRQLARAQEAAAVRSGAHAVSLAHVVGPFFITNPDEMFSLDRFHPSSMGYRRTAKAILPSVLAALGVEDRVPFGHHLPVPAASAVPAAPGGLGA